ncbi:MAG: NAD(P)/FAD-dependent oxidoreductase [Bryobacterales bacterium]|nr:NAD(P)/FAD-dependent oxidoreductase [Bryobacterales bacterium]
MGPQNQKAKAVIVGAGPAGLTAAYCLAKKGAPVTVLEADPQYVGGISRTASYKGFLFDIGGHRFFSKAKQVEDLWREILPDDFLDRPRMSRIFYGGKFYSYPLRAMEAFLNLGPFQSTACVLSYLKARAFPRPDVKSFQDWVTNQFGERLFNIFFKTYTEKVWGMSCKEISADWAAQRIKGLSLGAAIKNALFPEKPKDKSQVVKTLISSFRYPRKGPGMMWEQCAKLIRQMGGQIHMGRRVTGCRWDAATSTWTVTTRNTEGQIEEFQGEHAISSAPIRELIPSLDPKPAQKAVDAAASLRYRDFITVVLIVKDKDAFPDNWIYIHDPSVKVGRIQNFKSWSPEMVPDPAYSCYGLEYFCFEGDGVWTSPDKDLIALGASELEKIGLGRKADVVDGCVVRQIKAYPVYDDAYSRHVDTVREELNTRYPNLHLVGRNGMHKYNNQDHAMMTAMLTAENILAGKPVFDIWQVNQDAEYHEGGEAGQETGASGLRAVPTRVSS